MTGRLASAPWASLAAAAAAAVSALAVLASLAAAPWASLAVVAAAAAAGIVLGSRLAARPEVRAALSRAQESTLDPDLAGRLQDAAARPARTWAGRPTGDLVPRGPVAQLLASLAALAGYSWARHRRGTALAVAAAAGFAAVQFSSATALVAVRGALGVLAFTTAAVALVSLLTAPDRDRPHGRGEPDRPGG